MCIYKKINIMLPSYRRPDRLLLFRDSALNQSDDVNRLIFTVCVNESDTMTLNAIESWYWPCKYQVVLEDTDQPNLPLYFNKMLSESRYRSDDTLISMFGDDMIFQSSGWDSAFLNAMNEAMGKAIVYGDDCFIAHEKLCVHFVTSELVQKATKLEFMCPVFQADMIDLIWYKFGQLTGSLRYLNDVKIYHDHDSRRKREEWDETMLRLCPLRAQANGYSSNEAMERQQKRAVLYATMMAKNAVSEGVLLWAK